MFCQLKATNRPILLEVRNSADLDASESDRREKMTFPNSNHYIAPVESKFLDDKKSDY